MLRYCCPATDRTVLTGIRTTEDALSRLKRFHLSLWCPHCQTGHKIAAENASVDRSASAN
jgi:hypothetical protein